MSSTRRAKKEDSDKEEMSEISVQVDDNDIGPYYKFLNSVGEVNHSVR